MQCEQCGQADASVHLTQITDGAVRHLHLCAACAAKNGFRVEEPISLADLLAAPASASAPGAAASADEPRCPQCHMRLRDFRASSRLGCPACYDAFQAELEPMLLELHKSGTHVGKAPAAVQAIRDRQRQEEGLEQQLRHLIAAERFEEAARLRDELRSLRGESDAASPGDRP